MLSECPDNLYSIEIDIRMPHEEMKVIQWTEHFFGDWNI